MLHSTLESHRLGEPSKESQESAYQTSTDSISLHITFKQITDALEASNTLQARQIEKEFKCIPLQQELLSQRLVSSQPQTIRLDLSPDIVGSYERICYAWNGLSDHHEILRTIIVPSEEGDSQIHYYHRVLKRASRVRLGHPAKDRLSYYESEPASLFFDQTTSSPVVYFHIHPALADRTSLGILWKDFLSLLSGGGPNPCLPFNRYCELLHTRDLEASKLFWHDILHDVGPLTLHTIPMERHNSFQVTQSSTSIALSNFALNESSAKLSMPDNTAIIYTALWLLLSKHCQENSDSITFLVEGRDRTIAGHESVAGFADQQYPLRPQLDPKWSLSEAIQHTHGRNTLASAHSSIGYNSIKALHEGADCLVKVIVSEEDALQKPADSQVPITIHVQMNQRLSISAWHDTAISEGKMRVLLNHFATSLSRIVDSGNVGIMDVDVISPEEYAVSLELGKPLTEPVADNVHNLFERQVERTPHAPAVQFETDDAMTYSQLNYVANHVARQLPAKRGSFVPVCLHRSLNLVIALVAILKTGAAYVTLDPETPHDRNHFITEDVGADFVIVDRKTAGRFSNEIIIDDIVGNPYTAREQNLSRYCEPGDPVYVIYTSGSTGKPKGVLHVHSSATCGLDAFPTLPNLRQLLFHNPVFSAAQRSIWSTLKQGGCLCLASKDNLTIHIGRTINEMQINVIDVTPSTALLITPGTVPCLRRMTVAGELINPALIPMWVKEVELLNAYGLSENTQVNWRREMVLGQNPQNIGRPSDTTTAFVLIPGTTKLSPLLVPGELCLGGHQLAVRYLNRPEKTAEAFIDNPFGWGRLYRTGDMVVAHEDGSIEMIGRIDFQVKINGQRVEPGDSNTIIQTHPHVYSSSVVSADVNGRKALVGVVVQKSSAPDWPTMRSELKSLLKKEIPSYIMPTYWLVQDELPLNVNGKVDIPKLTKHVESVGRNHLLSFSSDHIGTNKQSNGDKNGETQIFNGKDSNLNEKELSSSDEGLSPALVQLRDIWASVLSLPPSRISPHDYFQSLGGSSLDAIKVLSKANEKGLRFQIADLLTLELNQISHHGEVAKAAKPESDDVSPFSLLPKDAKIDKETSEDAFPTTAMQDGVLADSLMDGSTYVYRRYYRLVNTQSADILEALQTLSLSHPVLRTTYVSHKASFLHVIRKQVQVSWESLDITAGEFSERPKKSVQLGGNFIFFSCLRNSVLAVTIHHALLDYWSNSFFMDDLTSTILKQPLAARPSFSNFVDYIRRQDQEQLKEFWRDRMQNVAPTLLGGEKSKDVAVYSNIDEDLQSFASDNKVSLGSLIYAAWAVVFGRHISKDKIAFGITLSGRDLPVQGVTRISGPTVATVPLSVNVDAKSTLVDLAKSIQKDVWEISPRAHFGLRNVLRASKHRTLVFDTIVNVLVRESDADPVHHNDVLQSCPPYEPNFLHDTMLEAELGHKGLKLSLLSSHLSSSIGASILGDVVGTLKTVFRSASTPISGIDPRSPLKHTFLSLLPNHQESASQRLAHSMLEKMSAQHPNKVALQDMTGTTLSYHEFQAAVDNAARHLRILGVQHGDIIPICLSKSLDTLVAVFGILKSGAAFTPLDPKSPTDRNKFIIKDVGANLAITDNVAMDVFDNFPGRVLHVNDIRVPCHDSYELGSHLPELRPESLAYIIYTSGSTGLPKGVQVSHSSVIASTEGMIEACKVDKEWHVLWFLNYVFDASYFDVFTVLGSGGTISIANQDAMINDLAACVNHFQVRQLMVTPTVSNLISPDDAPSLKTLLVCGEPITPKLVSKWATRMDVYNGYGPTEATILMTVSKVVPDGNLKSIGYPLKAVNASILHPDRLVPVPWGTVGELCVSGAHVARGYLNRPELTAAAFQKAADGTVVYRTGDFARWLPNNEIECLGRKDNQIKLNGFRIELGEIESAILAEAADLIQSVVVGQAQIQRKKQIVAFYVPREQPILQTAEEESIYPKAVLEPEVIRQRLHTLPHYMLPRILLPFSSFPVLASGKINRKKLTEFAEVLSSTDLAQYETTVQNGNHDGPQRELTSQEQILRDTWAELFDLPAESITLHDTFYHHGGDSIAAINLASTLRHLGYTLSVNEIVSSPALEEQAKLLKVSTSSVLKHTEFIVPNSVHEKLQAAGLSSNDIEEIYPCAPGQVEFLTQGHTKEQFWQLMTVRRLPENFDLNQWIKLTTELTKLNQILRAMYLKQDEDDPLSWVQVILKDPILDMSIRQCSVEDDTSALIQAHFDQRFKLGKPFVRYLILQYSNGTMDLCIKLDHAMYDGTLFRIFDDQFAALRDGRLPPTSTSFRDFIQYSQQTDKTSMKSFWKTLLAENNFSYPSHIAQPRVHGAVVASFPIPVDKHAQKIGVTPSIIFQAAYTILLSKLGAADDVTYDYLLTGRNVDMDGPQTINGTCANFLPFRSRIASQNTINSLLKETQALFWQVTENGLVSLGEIYRHLGVERAAHAAKTLFLFQPFEPAVGEQDHMRWIVMAMSKVTMFVNYAIMFEVFKDVRGHRLKMQYDDRLFTKDEAQAALDLYQRIVQVIVNSGDSLFGDAMDSV